MVYLTKPPWPNFPSRSAPWSLMPMQRAKLPRQHRKSDRLVGMARQVRLDRSGRTSQGRAPWQSGGVRPAQPVWQRQWKWSSTMHRMGCKPVCSVSSSSFISVSLEPSLPSSQTSDIVPWKQLKTATLSVKVTKSTDSYKISKKSWVSLFDKEIWCQLWNHLNLWTNLSIKVYLKYHIKSNPV